MKSGKIAYIIYAHHKPLQLARLVEKLAHPSTDFYIHIDKKSDIKSFQRFLDSQDNIFWVNQVKANWASIGMVDAMINSFKAVLNSGISYEHIALTTGQDYPIKSPAYLRNFYLNNAEKIYMDNWSFQAEHWKEEQFRLFTYTLKYKGRIYKYPGQQRKGLLNTLIYCWLKLRHWLKPRRLPYQMEHFAGLAYWSAPPHVFTYILNYLQEHPDFYRFHRNSFAPDEMLFHTILLNSPEFIRDNIVNDGQHFTYWKEATASHPELLTMEHIDLVEESSQLWGRKFDIEKSEILDYLDKTHSSHAAS